MRDLAMRDSSSVYFLPIYSIPRATIFFDWRNLCIANTFVCPRAVARHTIIIIEYIILNKQHEDRPRSPRRYRSREW
jgi:hypothetical protein